MAKNLTFRLTAEGIDEFRRQAEAAGDAGKAAFDRFAASIPGLGDQMERQRQRAEQMRDSLSRAAEVNFRNLEASLDPVAAKMRAAAEGAETVNTALKAGAISHAEADRAMGLLAQHYGESSRAADGFGVSLTGVTGILKTFGLALSATGVYRFGREVLETTEQGREALTKLGDSFQGFKDRTSPIIAGFAREATRDLGYVNSLIDSINAALAGQAPGGVIGALQARGFLGGVPEGERFPAGFEPPGVTVTQQVFGGNTRTPDDFFLRFAESKQRQLDAAAEARKEYDAETARALKALDDLDADLHENRMRRFHEEVEEARRAAEARVSSEEQALKALDDTDRFLSDEKMRRFHAEVQEQVRAADQAAREAAAASRAGWENFFRYFDHASAGQFAKFSLIGRIALDMLQPRGGVGSPSLSGLNLSGLFGGGAASAGADGIPDAVAVTPQVFGSHPGGFMTGVGGFLSKASPYLQAAGMGGAIGSTGLFGGNAQNSSIGGTIGGLAGFAVGGPIGGLIGSLGGSLLGSLFGPSRPSNFTAVANFGGGFGVTGMGGDKPNQNTTGLAGAAGSAVEQAIAELKGYGLGFSRGLDYLAIGEQRNSYFRLAGGAVQTIGSTGDANDLAFQAVKAMLGGASGGSQSLLTALSGGTSLSDLSARAQFVTGIYDVVTKGAPEATQFESAMKSLVKQFEEGAEKSRQFGLSVTAFTEGFAKSFDQNVRLQLLAIQRPLEYSLELWRRDAQARLNTAAQIGGDLGQVRELNAALFRQMNAPAISALTGLQNQIGFGSFSAAAPGDQYFAALEQFNRAKASALSGGDANAFVSAASSFLPLARNYLGTSTRYGDLSREVSSIAGQLIEQRSVVPDLTPHLEAANAIASAGFASIVEEQKETRREIQRLNGQVLALLSRMAA